MRRAPLFVCAAALAAASPAVFAQSPAPLLIPAYSADPAAVARDARQVAQRPQIIASSYVKVDRAALRPFENGLATRPTWSLWLADQSHTAVLDSVERTWGRHTVFRGRVGEDGSLILAVGPDGVAAAAIRVGDREFTLEHAGGSDRDLHVLYQLDHDRMPAWMGCGTDHRHEVAAAGAPALEVDNPLTPIVDVAVFYTPATKAGAGSRAAIEAQIVLRVAAASTSSEQSGVNHVLRLVHAAETPYVEVGTSTDLSRFRGTSDGYMDEVHAARSAYGADLMALLIERSSQFCGVGYLMTNESTGFRSWAFSVTVRTCLDGHTLTHEMGHTMGCSHDRANANNAVRPYAYGYRTPDNRYRTIMAYRPGSRVPVWSNPSFVHSGQAMGSPTENNARSLNEVTGTLSAFAPMTVYRWHRHGGGIPALGTTPLLLGSGTKTNLAPVAVEITHVAPGRAGALAVGGGGQNLPLFGGVLVPFVFDAIPVTAGSPSAVFDASAIRGLPVGTEVFFQAWFVDPSASQGVSASDALSVITH